MDCKACKENREYISRHVHESDLDRLERINKRWFIAWLITFVLLVACVAGFIYYESQWEVVETVEVSQENDGGYNNYIGNDGDIYNGETNHQGNKIPRRKVGGSSGYVQCNMCHGTGRVKKRKKNR